MLVEFMQIPVVTTWGACDLLPHSHPLNIGGFGTHGTRAANFCIQNADYLLCMGTRLDTKATGTPAASFARAAHIVMVDVDRAEIAKMEKCGVKVHGKHMPASRWIWHFVDSSQENGIEAGYHAKPEWTQKCQDWKRRFPPVVPDVIHELSNYAKEGDVIVSDTGCALAWMMQGFRFKENQRFLHPFNNTPMGYGLPGAIGAHYATGKRVICVTGDGSIMMSIGELATIAEQKLPIEITVLNNHAHAMCMQSEREWFNCRYAATTQSAGLSFPNFEDVMRAFKVIKWNVVEMSPDIAVSPKNKSGAPLEEMYPMLTKEQLQSEMLIPLYA